MALRTPFIEGPDEDKEWTISVELGPDGKAQDVVAWRIVPDEELDFEDAEEEQGS